MQDARIQHGPFLDGAMDGGEAPEPAQNLPSLKKRSQTTSSDDKLRHIDQRLCARSRGNRHAENSAHQSDEDADNHAQPDRYPGNHRDAHRIRSHRCEQHKGTTNDR